MDGLEAATRLVSRRLVVGNPRAGSAIAAGSSASAAGQREGRDVRQVADGRHDVIVQAGGHRQHLRSHGRPQAGGARQPVGGGSRRGAQDASPPPEQLRRCRLGPEALGARQRMTGHEGHRRRQSRLDVTRGRPLHAAHVDDEGARRQRGRRGVDDRRDRRERHGQDDGGGACHRLRGGGRGAISESQRLGARQRNPACRPNPTMPSKSPTARPASASEPPSWPSPSTASRPNGRGIARRKGRRPAAGSPKPEPSSPKRRSPSPPGRSSGLPKAYRPVRAVRSPGLARDGASARGFVY